MNGVKIFFVIGSLFLSSLNAQEKEIPHTSRVFEDLIQKLYLTLDSKSLGKEEVYKLHDILGSLKICHPLIQTTLNYHDTYEKDLILSSPHSLSHTQTIHLSIEELEKIKGSLLHLLKEKSIETSQLETTYTMIGTINLCLPILKGTSLLIEHMEQNKPYVADHIDHKENKEIKEIKDAPAELTPSLSEEVNLHNSKTE